MTLLNTLTNIGAKWSTVLCLYMLPKMTFHVCEGYTMLKTRQILPFPCTMQESSACTEHGGSCAIEVDGYTIQVSLGIVAGIVWLLTFYGKMQQLQALPHTDWLISSAISKGK